MTLIWHVFDPILSGRLSTTLSRRIADRWGPHSRIVWCLLFSYLKLLWICYVVEILISLDTCLVTVTFLFYAPLKFIDTWAIFKQSHFVFIYVCEWKSWISTEYLLNSWHFFAKNWEEHALHFQLWTFMYNNHLQFCTSYVCNIFFHFTIMVQ